MKGYNMGVKEEKLIKKSLKKVCDCCSECGVYKHGKKIYIQCNCLGADVIDDVVEKLNSALPENNIGHMVAKKYNKEVLVVG
jgi:hypothetical protein